MNKWKAQNTSKAKNLGIIEFKSFDGEYHTFEVLETESYLVFGGFCNTGFLESGNFKIDEFFSLDGNLNELLSDLESYYNDGVGCQSEDFSCNERM